MARKNMHGLEQNTAESLVIQARSTENRL